MIFLFTDIGQEYERNFRGMTTEPMEPDALLAARERRVQELQSSLDVDERSFLLSLVNASELIAIQLAACAFQRSWTTVSV